MFDIAWSELLIVALVALIVVGPKDLPHMLNALGKMIAKVRRTGDDFRREFEASMREAGGEELRKEYEDIRLNNPLATIHNEMHAGFRPAPPQGFPPALTATPADAPPAVIFAPQSASLPVASVPDVAEAAALALRAPPAA